MKKRKKWILFFLSVTSVFSLSVNDFSGGFFRTNVAYAAAVPPDIPLEKYEELVAELEHISDRRGMVDKKVQIDGEIRFHYGANRGPFPKDDHSSGLRIRVGLDSALSRDWHIHSMVEGKKDFHNYEDSLELERLYVTGKVGESALRAGKFGYLMADGNIYDSAFTGVRFDTGDVVKYTLSYGKTNYSQKTTVATVQYRDYDYDLEGGIYHYKRDGDGASNTLWTVGGNYYFDDFSIGAMYLQSSLSDRAGNRSGYVVNLKHGELKTYRPGTYTVFAKYYDQPKNTYISHGMNGLANRMEGFKGYSLGVHHTVARNVVAGLEYYGLQDKITGSDGNTWWFFVSRYF